MKKYVSVALMIIVATSLSACGNEMEQNKESKEYFSSESTETEDTVESDVDFGDLESENTDSGVIERTESKTIKLDFSGTTETYAEGEEAEPFTLIIESKEDNGISWANEWYEENNLSLPMLDDTWREFYDNNYKYVWTGDNVLLIYDTQDFLLYEITVPTDSWYINGNNAYLKDGILYAGSVLNGYATPNTCFMFAYDIINDKLIWRSPDQTYNSMNFVVKDDVIICGYGFTDEKDFIYQLDINTGKVLGKTELEKMPDLMVEQDGKLYVHTYSYDYVFEIQ